MEIYLLGDISTSSLQSLKEILIKLGHAVYFQEKRSDKNFLPHYKEVKNNILGADAVITDAGSFDNLTQFELAMSVDRQKPTLIVIPKESEILKEFLGIQNNFLTLKIYANKKELEKILKEYIEEIEGTLNAKIFMIIPPSVNKYLDWVVENTKFSKSDIVRSGVEKVAKKDKVYQGFLKKTKAN